MSHLTDDEAKQLVYSKLKQMYASPISPNPDETIRWFNPMIHGCMDLGVIPRIPKPSNVG